MGSGHKPNSNYEEQGGSKWVVDGELEVTGTQTNNSISFNTDYSETGLEPIGALFWDDKDKTLTTVLPNGVKLQLGHELYKMCVNKTGDTIPNGAPVYVNDAQGQRPTIELADASNYTNSLKTIGVTTQDIENNAEGKVTISGEVRDLDTSDYEDGDCLYVSTTAGEFTTTPPSDGNARIAVGMVLNTHPTQGKIIVCIRPNWYMFGAVDDGNYSYFESDGTLVAKGDAKCWRDELQSLVGQRLLSPSGAIDYNFEEGTVDFANNADLGDYVVMNVQVNHDWDETTPIKPHIHWFQSQDAIPNWLIQYRWQTNGQAKTTAWVDRACQEGVFTYSSGTIINICSFGEIAIPANVGTSDILQIRLLRDTDNDSGEFAGEDAYTGTVSGLNFDVHIAIDTLGSRSEFTK